MNQFLSNKIIAGIVALALLVGVGVLVSSGDTSSTTRNAALVVAKHCTKPGQVTKVSKQSVVCAALSPKNIWYPVFQEKKWICAKLGITRKQNGIFSVCGKSKSSKKRWFLTKPVMASSNPGLPTTDQEAFVKLTTNPELIVETSPTTPLALAATTETTLTPTTETSTSAPTSTPTSTPTTTTPTTTTPTLAPTAPTLAPTAPTIPKTCAEDGDCKVGDTGPGGGKVFYVASGNFTSTGSDCGTACKYLEAAPSDQGKIAWCSNTSSSRGATAQGIGSGMSNTTTADSTCTSGAIRVAADYTNNSKTDWHLPSKDELNQMCKWQRGVAWVSDATVCTGGTLNSGTGASGFSTVTYWSSSEDAATTAWSQRFDNGYQYYNDKAYLIKTFTYYVRPVRAF